MHEMQQKTAVPSDRKSAAIPAGKSGGEALFARFLLNLLAASYTYLPRLRGVMKTRDGWMDFAVGLRTENDSIRQGIRFSGGRARALNDIPRDVAATIHFKDESAFFKLIQLPPNESFNLLLKNEMRMTGNLVDINKFNYLLSVALEKKHAKMLEQARAKDLDQVRSSPERSDAEGANKLAARRKSLLRGEKADAVRFLDNPYLSQFSLDDFPRVKAFLDIHFTQKPEICCERPRLLTEWFRENGFETHADGSPWIPELRQAAAFKYLMERRAPAIRKNDLIAGTTTTKEIGVVLYPDTHGAMIWGELRTVPNRILNPYDVSEETREILHREVFPFWEHRNMREWVRDKYGEPLCQRLDERFAVYFMWKTAAISHTIADFPKLLALGTDGIRREIDDELAAGPGEEKKNLLEAMKLTLEGLEAYAGNLSKQARLEAESEANAVRKQELSEIAEVCARVPRLPARTLHEAINAVWIGWIGLHMENTNAGLSLGRMDQWLQPYFAADMDRLATDEERAAYVKRAVELVGCFYMRCTDHLPLVPDIGNFLFGGSSSGQVITLGGVAPDGSSAVNDMTHIFLKVTEMLGMRDPNINARFHPGVNSDVYLKRLCEVNLITSATPSLHNDRAVMASLAEFGYPDEHLRDWSAVGCVEPTLSGRHMGHTNCMMMNMVAAVEMALNDGRHPLMDWEVGPKTGDPAAGDFETFEDFFGAFENQFEFLIEQSCEYNNLLGEAHSLIRPTPLLSAMMDGPLESGRDITRGGARYNTSGAACIGLADVVDSLMAVKRLVYDEKKATFERMKRAIDANFQNDPELHALVTNKAPKFGSGDDEARAMAERVARFAHDRFGARVNFRGGKYTAGFWSMSNHVAFGCLAGALPSGRLAGKPFTPGLTPAPNASDNLLDLIHDVSKLKHENMNNNIAFNVKITPSSSDSHERAVGILFSYAKTYFDLGGMQMQMNVVTSDILRDAMKNPESYRNLIVRISGYNAYFVTLNREMQRELIERAEYGAAS